MSESRQRYNQTFKEETVKYIQQHSKPLTEIAEELNIPVNTLRQWVAKYRQFPDEPFVGSGNLRNHDQIVKDLEERNKDLEEELAILKKALHIFSKDRK
ncbi:transposase [Paenibacillus lemnae]|uniref:Transposase n=1 Tax=Paenibacillus lemnae TaxID=1330551 RepID=A0A848M370_PAELE|nr:transposase [Paenibacillus lemnae]NMO95215.1 transposase [Paenibacillus lemnae]